jgi:hypothetical protein
VDSVNGLEGASLEPRLGEHKKRFVNTFLIKVIAFLFTNNAPCAVWSRKSLFPWAKCRGKRAVVLCAVWQCGRALTFKVLAEETGVAREFLSSSPDPFPCPHPRSR